MLNQGKAINNMNRREFIKQSAKITGVGLLSNSLLGCDKYHDLFPETNIGLSNGITWSNFQLTLERGNLPGFDDDEIAGHWVIKDGSTYKMWYSGRSPNWDNIFYCESSNGVNWTNFQVSLTKGAEGTNDTGNIYYPCVIKDGSIYKMWYSGGAGANLRTIYCDSADGINWSNFKLAVDINSLSPYDTQRAYIPAVIKDGSLYKMWYLGYTATGSRIIYCESADGKTWSNYKLVLDHGAQGVYDAGGLDYHCIVKDNGIYKMWYSGWDGTTNRILYCESDNGINWSNFQLSIDLGAQGVYDTNIVLTPRVINDGGVAKIWYFGSDGTDYRVIYGESR